MRTNSILKSSVALVAFGLLAGCDTKGFLNPWEIAVRSGQPEPLVVPILSTVDPVAERGPADYANAQLPRPTDLVSSTADYQIDRNDLLNVSISDLMAPGQETVKVVRVSESGNISLPYLGSLHAGGMTEFELEQGIIQAYRDANLIQNSQVSVTVVEARNRTVEILGAVTQPGQYAILDSDFRLLNALVQARDVTSPLVEYIYVVRRSENRPTSNATTKPSTPAMHNGSAPLNPSNPGKTPTSVPSPDDLAPKSDAGTHADSLAKAASANHPLTLVAEAPLANSPSPLVDDAPVAVASAKAPGDPMAAPTAATHNFEFSAPASSDADRVIKIPYPALKAGNLSFNIAIHPHDLIIVQQLPVGEYYVGGHVARPGVYTLTGRHITLEQAITSAGMFDDLAIPQRTEIIRRINPDRQVFVRVDLERVMDGEQPDVYLKPDDQIMVGTNALAPFLSAARGAFRLTYGFGFLYDRNFAYSSNTQGF